MRQPVLAVFTAPIPNTVCVAGVYPPLRNDDIASCTSAKVRTEKYCAWKLLEYALLQAFGKDMREVSFTKSPDGKWNCDFCYFSLSHSENMVAVAVADCPVGVDIEKIGNLKNQSRVAEKILSETELAEYKRIALCDDSAKEFLLDVWTKKESLFKLDGKGGFIPHCVSAFTDGVFTRKINAEDGVYFLSVACDIADFCGDLGGKSVADLAKFYENCPFLE